MISVEEAKRLILENTHVLDPVEVNLEESLGLVLAEDIVSPLDLPAFTNSAMDGYALKSYDTEGAHEGFPAFLRIMGIIKAGDTANYELKNGEAIKVMTGAPIPPGADAVVMVEHTEVQEETLVVKRKIKPGENIRYKGEEIRRGDVALLKGTVITPASIGFLTELNVKRVRVYRKPKISLVVTGEELLAPDEEPRLGKIRDTNSITLKFALSREPTEVISVDRVRDRRSAIEEKVERALRESDVVVITGGVSTGDYDYVRGVLESLGVRSIFWKVLQKPGGPLFFGKKDLTTVFGLPGNPASTLVCFYEYVLPSIRIMLGKNNKFLVEVDALISEEIRKKADNKTHFLRGYIQGNGKHLYVKLTGPQGSHMLRSFALSNCLIVVPQNVTYLAPGSLVKVHLLPEVFL